MAILDALLLSDGQFAGIAFQKSTGIEVDEKEQRRVLRKGDEEERFAANIIELTRQ